MTFPVFRRRLGLISEVLLRYQLITDGLQVIDYHFFHTFFIFTHIESKQNTIMIFRPMRNISLQTYRQTNFLKQKNGRIFLCKNHFRGGIVG